MDFKRLFAEALAQHTGMDAAQLSNLISVPPNPVMGDLAFACFSLAKERKTAPPAIAQELAKAMSHDLFRFQAAGPYLNAFIQPTAIFSQAFAPKVRPQRAERIIVEYMNANPNKPLHIGQARNICIGDTIIRTSRLLGYETHASNYGDDSGVNVGYNIVGHLYYGIPFETTEKFDHFCGDVYTQMRKRDEDPAFKEILSKTLKKIEEGEDKEFLAFHKAYTTKCAIAQFETCWRMHAFFDVVIWETDILHLMLFDEAMNKLQGKPQVFRATEGPSAGCLVIDLSSMDYFKGVKNPLQVLIKSDGVATYTAKDIAFALWKLGFVHKEFRYLPMVEQPNGTTVFTTSLTGDQKGFGNYDIAISVIDNRQSHPQNVVKGALNLLGYLSEKKQYIHLPYGVVYLTPTTLASFGFDLSEEEKKEERLPFSSRKGWSVSIDETLDLLKKKAYEESHKREDQELLYKGCLRTRRGLTS